MARSPSRQRLTRALPGSFNDERHLDAWRRFGRFPKIHDPIVEVLRCHVGLEGRSVIEFGSCLGLLAARMIVELHADSVVAIEGNTADAARSIEVPGLWLRQFYVSEDTLQLVSQLVIERSVTVAVGRRVFSEIGYDDPSLVTRLGRTLRDAGVREIVLQGRRMAKNPAVPLFCSELEAEALAPAFHPAGKWGDVVLLKAAS